MAMPIQGLTRAVQGGAESFFRGKRYAEDESDRERKRQQEGAQLGRQKVLESRADEGYQHDLALRPRKDEAVDLALQGARQGVEKGGIEIDKAKEDEQVNNLKGAWSMARYGDLDGALERLNKTKSSEEQIRALEWHPNDPGQDIVIATDKNGNKRPFDLRQLDKRFKPQSEKGRFSSDKYGVLDTQTGVNKPHAAGVGDDGETPKIVELANGERLPREEVRKSFETTYGKFDPTTKLFVWQDGTPNYFDWYNSVVTEKHRFPVTEAKQTGMSDSEARTAAKKIANERDPVGPNFLRPGATKEAYGGMTREEFILKKAQELQSGAMSDGLTPAPATPAATPRIPEPHRQNIIPPGVKTKADLDKLQQQRANKDYRYLW